jgi:hypothetical protein
MSPLWPSLMASGACRIVDGKESKSETPFVACVKPLPAIRKDGPMKRRRALPSHTLTFEDAVEIHKMIKAGVIQ